MHVCHSIPCSHRDASQHSQYDNMCPLEVAPVPVATKQDLDHPAVAIGTVHTRHGARGMKGEKRKGKRKEKEEIEGML